MTQFSIARLQLDLSSQDNVSYIRTEIDKLMSRFPWVNMIVLGNQATYSDNIEHARNTPDEVERLYCDVASIHGVWLIPGSLFKQRMDIIFNTLPVINSAGEVVSRYSKAFTLAPYDTGFSSAEDLLEFDIPEAGRCNISITYDPWLPETSHRVAWVSGKGSISPVCNHVVQDDADLTELRANMSAEKVFFFSIDAAGTLAYG
ncbi:MAG: hypothetical protein V7711_10495 [Pseudomonadales bacterium]